MGTWHCPKDFISKGGRGGEGEVCLGISLSTSTLPVCYSSHSSAVDFRRQFRVSSLLCSPLDSLVPLGSCCPVQCPTPCVHLTHRRCVPSLSSQPLDRCAAIRGQPEHSAIHPVCEHWPLSSWVWRRRPKLAPPRYPGSGAGVKRQCAWAEEGRNWPQRVGLPRHSATFPRSWSRLGKAENLSPISPLSFCSSQTKLSSGAWQ